MVRSLFILSAVVAAFFLSHCKTSNRGGSAKSSDGAFAPSFLKVISCAGDLEDQTLSGPKGLSGKYSLYISGERGLIMWSGASGLEVNREANCQTTVEPHKTVCTTALDSVGMEEKASKMQWSYEVDHSQEDLVTVLGMVQEADAPASSLGLHRIGQLAGCKVENAGAPDVSDTFSTSAAMDSERAACVAKADSVFYLCGGSASLKLYGCMTANKGNALLTKGSVSSSLACTMSNDATKALQCRSAGEASQIFIAREQGDKLRLLYELSGGSEQDLGMLTCEKTTSP